MASSRGSRRSFSRGPLAFGAALLSACAVFLAPVADASVLRGFTLQDLRQKADAIVVGKVVGVRTVRTAGRIETIARIRVRESVRGSERGLVTVRALGGMHGGQRLVVPGAARFVPGQEVLVFLYRDGDDYRTVGMYQGLWLLDGADPTMARPSDSGGASLLRPERGVTAVSQHERAVAQLVGGGAR